MKEFYTTLISVFEKEENKDRYRLNGLLPPQFFDIYAGQDLDPESFDIYPMPAIFLTWSIDHRQTPAQATITFRLCYEQMRDTSSLGKNTAEALKFIDFMEITDHILSKIQTKYTGKLIPATEEPNLEPVVIDQYLLTYTCSYNKKIYDNEDRFQDLQIQGAIFKNVLD